MEPLNEPVQPNHYLPLLVVGWSIAVLVGLAFAFAWTS